MRRHDIDWLRTLALGLLIIYHAAICFQPWATKIYFIQNEESLEGLWIIMAMMNIWRIPILFLVSGMGVYFAMERRTGKQLLKERSGRILLPFISGSLLVCPITIYTMAMYNGENPGYIPNPGHLWFLGNIFLYVLLLLPLLAYLKARPDHTLLRGLKAIIALPGGLVIIALPLAVEAWVMDPEYFSAYPTPHGFFYGMICFLIGFVLVSMRDAFWTSVERVRFGALAVAFGLYLVRLIHYELQGVPNPLTAVESAGWMLAILGFGSRHLNQPSAALRYLSQAVYPVYIVHLPIQMGLAYFLLPLAVSAAGKVVVLWVMTFAGSWLLYEGILRRLKWIRPLFGMRLSG